MSFFGMVVKTVKNGLRFDAKRGSKHNYGTWLVNIRRNCDLTKAWLTTPGDLWTKEKICPLCYSWHKFSLCGISYKIERRLYQEILLPNLKWRKQALKRFCGFRRLESPQKSPISPQKHEVFQPASKPGYPNIWRADIFKKIREISRGFLSWCVLWR